MLSGLQTGDIPTPTFGCSPDAEAIPLIAWLAGCLVAATCLGLGLFPATSCSVLIAANGLLLLTDHQLYSNHRWLLIVLCAWFAFARSDRAWALGARRRRERSDGLVPWWPQLLLIATISSVYLYSGLCKINAEFLSGAMLVEMTPRWVPATLLAWTTPPAEIAIGVGIWFRRTRWMALTTGVILHLGIVVLLGAPLVFGAFALLCFAGYPSVATAPVGAILQAAPAATQRSSAA